RTDGAPEGTREVLCQGGGSQGGLPARQELRSTIDVERAAPSEAVLSHARGSLSGRNRALLGTVAAAVKEDLLRVKDALDLHLRTGDGDVSTLQPQVEVLGRVADTLGMLGLGVARNVVQQQRDTLQSTVDSRLPVSEDTLLDVDGALLYVEATLDDQVERLGAGDGEAGQDDLSGGEAHRLLEAIVREAIANFANARQ